MRQAASDINCDGLPSTATHLEVEMSGKLEEFGWAVGLAHQHSVLNEWESERC